MKILFYFHMIVRITIITDLFGNAIIKRVECKSFYNALKSLAWEGISCRIFHIASQQVVLQFYTANKQLVTWPWFSSFCTLREANLFLNFAPTVNSCGKLFLIVGLRI